jgi:hypothetical protein
MCCRSRRAVNFDIQELLCDEHDGSSSSFDTADDIPFLVKILYSPYLPKPVWTSIHSVRSLPSNEEEDKEEEEVEPAEETLVGVENR